ncbi:MAG: dihydropteroate synthase [Halieaceae bacterium]|nr:dihydropteroate synthase [Halieaceae bacterium]
MNITPDSFSDGGALFKAGRPALDAIRRQAVAMVADGAAILDIGGESTRPGAEPVSVQQELDRVIPCLEAIRPEVDVTLSVDTSTPEVMRAAAAAGANLINDVRALRREGALQTAVSLGLPVCLMHMQGEPDTMQQSPRYQDVVAEVCAWLADRAGEVVAAGLPAERILLDPGFGFGKTVTHNLQLLQGLPTLAALGFPLLVGLSRKSMIGKLIGRDTHERLPASLALAVLAAERGASIIRTHDVRETADALAMVRALANPAQAVPLANAGAPESPRV